MRLSTYIAYAQWTHKVGGRTKSYCARPLTGGGRIPKQNMRPAGIALTARTFGA